MACIMRLREHSYSPRRERGRHTRPIRRRKVRMHEVDVATLGQNVAPLLTRFSWNYLPDAILEGTLGHALADDPEAPNVAALEAPASSSAL